MADATLEERVAALEAEMEALTENSYQMSYSGEQMESILNFVEARKIAAGRVTAAVNSNYYTAITDVNYDDYNTRPVCFVDLCYSSGNSEVRRSVNITVENSNGKIAFRAYCTDLPSSATKWFRYIIMEKT